MAELKLGGHMKLLSLLKAGVISLMAGMATVHAGDSTTLGTSAALPMNLPIATEGTACSAKGLTAFSNTGLLLTCQSGVWRSQGGSPTCGASAAGYYCQFPNGLTQQWGLASGPGWVSLPTQFSSANYAVIPVIHGDYNRGMVAAKEGSIHARGRATNGFYLNSGPDISYYGSSIFWFAIGL